MYCVYLTIYRGNQLPPFYIGSTTLSRINSGYRGSVSSRKYKPVWKRELAMAPHLFHTHVLFQCASRTEATEKEAQLQRKVDAVRNPLYINTVIAGAGFGGLCGSDNPMHRSRRTGSSNPHYGRKHSEESKALMRSKALQRGSYGRQSDDHKQKRLAALRRHLDQRAAAGIPHPARGRRMKPKTEAQRLAVLAARSRDPKYQCPICELVSTRVGLFSHLARSKVHRSDGHMLLQEIDTFQIGE